MKKLYITIMFFVILILSIKDVNASNEEFCWVRVYQNNITYTNTDTTTTLQIDYTFIDTYYLIDITDLAGNDIDFTIVGGQKIASGNINFTRYTKNIKDIEYDEYVIVLAESNNMTITYESLVDSKFTVLEKNYNDVNEFINDTSSIPDDFYNLGLNIGSINSDEIRLINVGNGFNGSEYATYFYLYIPYEFQKQDYYTFDFGYDNKIASVDFTLVNIANNIYKFKFVNSSSRFFDEVQNFRIHTLNLNYITRTDCAIAEQEILYSKIDNEVNFTTIDKIQNVVEGDYFYHSFLIDDENKVNDIFGNMYDVRARVHYVLFDVYINNSKLTDKHTINEVNLSYDYTYEAYENNKIDKLDIGLSIGDYILNGPADLIGDVYMHSNGKATDIYKVLENDSTHKSLTEEKKYVELETITPGSVEFDRSPEITNWKDYLKKLNGDYKVRTFEKLSAFDEKQFSGMEDLEYDGQTFCVFLGDFDNTGNFVSTSMERNIVHKEFKIESLGDKFYNWLGYNNYTSTVVDYLPVINSESIKFFDIEYEYQGQVYTANIDNTKISYKGPSSFFPGDEEDVEGEGTLWDMFLEMFESFFGFSFYFVIFGAILILGIVIFILILLYLPAFAPFMRLSFNVFIKMITLPLLLINKILDKIRGNKK